MIVSIRGKILKKAPTEIIVDVNGLGYLCFITINTYDKLGCSSGSANCFDDEGFASVTDVKLGVMYEME